MEKSALDLITQVFVAIGTIVVCILAVWGDKVCSYIASPKLQFELHNSKGDLTSRQNGRRTIYYHLKIRNKRHWAAHVMFVFSVIRSQRKHLTIPLCKSH